MHELDPIAPPPAASEPGWVPGPAWFDRDPLAVAPDLLGAFITTVTDDGSVTLRITEVEAYRGEQDPASHAFRGRTARNASMFGGPGRLYVYRHLGLHTCVNVVCGPSGLAAAVLLRAGEVTGGLELARERRLRSGVARSAVDLARGPARLAVALGIVLAADGTDVTAPSGAVVVHRAYPGAAAATAAMGGPPGAAVVTGPRVGVGGEGAFFPWRFWLSGEPTVSAYRPAPRRAPRLGRP